jgi:hypothetical protein
MSALISWYDEANRIVMLKFSEQWTWTDLRDALREAHSLTHPNADRTDYFLDLRDSSLLPNGAIQQVRNIASEIPPNWGVSVVVHNSLFIQVMIQAIRRLHPELAARFQLAETIEEGLALIEESRVTSRGAPLAVPIQRTTRLRESTIRT